MSAKDKIAKALEGIPDAGFARLQAAVVVDAGAGITDPRAKLLIDGAAAVIEDYRRSRAEFGLEPLPASDPRLEIYQLAGELRHLLSVVQ